MSARLQPQMGRKYGCSTSCAFARGGERGTSPRRGSSRSPSDSDRRIRAAGHDTLGTFPGCGNDEGDLGECAPDSSAQQAEGAQALQQSCTAGHTTTKSGNARGGAPEGINLDDLDEVRSNKAEIYAAVSEGAMPLGGKLPDATIPSLRVYLACGAQVRLGGVTELGARGEGSIPLSDWNFSRSRLLDGVFSG
ncbi:c-type cytochrome [Sorangium sp. So ce124]|uniref:c-type cytochrome n=1 Tax=Sorangium sp. So ce124 TaxID=3133280 RepID=UPI003F5F667D